MKKWLESKEAKIYPWLIFSSKYGIIEPDHPIRNYDIHFIYDPGAISEKTKPRLNKLIKIDLLKKKLF